MKALNKTTASAALGLLRGMVTRLRGAVLKKEFLSLVTGLCVLGASAPAALADYTVPAKQQWWSDARFGMFIHFGSYSYLGGGEWAMDTGYTKQQYQTQVSLPFYPSSFNAATIVGLAKAAGQKYIVITAKHHEGYAMWNRTTPSFKTYDGAKIYSLPAYSGFTRDILGELKAECVKQGIHFCLYYSIIDWNHPSQTWSMEGAGLTVMSSTAARNAYIADMKTELAELITKYNPEVLWFDGDWFAEPPYQGNALMGWWQHTDGQNLYNYLIGLKPTLVINERVKRDFGLGDFAVAENGMPGSPMSRPWELNTTMNGTWGYNSGAQSESSYRSVASFVQELATAASREGNYLLNIGPDGNGNVPPLTTSRLNGIAAWMNVHGNSIYGTTRNPFVSSPSWGVCTKKSGALYCHVFTWPGTTLAVPAISNAISRIYLMNNPGTSLSYTVSGGNINITVPGSAPNANDSVVVIECTGVPAPAASGSALANGTYKIVARHSGKAMDANGAGTADGTQIVQWTYGGGNNQRWTVTDRGSSQYSIIGVQSGKGIDINGASTANGAKVQLWTYGGANNQKFTFTFSGGYYRITPVHATGSCLDVNGASTADGALVQLWGYSGSNNQQWAFQTP
jgi:alpha-L-fucosidase